MKNEMSHRPMHQETHWMKEILPIVVNIGIYYLFLLMNPEWYVRGHQIGIIVSALIAEFVMVKKEVRMSYSSLMKTKIILTHLVIYTVEGVVLELLIGDMGLSSWIVPVITEPIAIIVHHFMEAHFVIKDN